MKAMVVGGGGREHAIAWKLAASRSIEKVYVAPGNAGTATEPKVTNIPISSDDIRALAEFAKNNDIGLTVIGPEKPLVDGIVDRFNDMGLRCLGPTKHAAKLEGSKAFAKEFMERYQIPTARYRVFRSSKDAVEYARKMGPPVVIKADGLASGKGVYIANTLLEAEGAIREILDQNRFGTAGNLLVIEDFLIGEEISFICLVNNKQILPLATSQDHKARDAGNIGPNTGGMGAYSPALTNPDIYDRIMELVIRPTIMGLIEEGISYIGFLYAGLIIDKHGQPYVLEYNCRSGDPETQPILMRLQSDLAQLFDATLSGDLFQMEVRWDPRVALGVVMAAGGYPNDYTTGDTIFGLKEVSHSNTKVFHSGTQLKGEKVITNGGRVLCITALGNNVSTAQSSAYQSVRKIRWNQAYFRSDIGYRALEREHSNNSPSL